MSLIRPAMKNALPIALRRARRRGLSIVETAIALPLFMFLLFGIVDVGRVMFAQQTLQHAVREGGRFAVTGRSIDDGSGGQMPRVDSIIATVLEHIAPLKIDSADIHVSSILGGAGSGGGPGDSVTIQITHPISLITPLIGQYFPGGQYVCNVSTTFKNEPFPIGMTN